MMSLHKGRAILERLRGSNLKISKAAQAILRHTEKEEGSAGGPGSQSIPY